MKIPITFKTPDAVHYAIQKQISVWAWELEDEDPDVRESIIDGRVEELREAISKFVPSEYVTIVIDTDQPVTAEVLPASGG